MAYPVRIRITETKDKDGLQLVSGWTQAKEFVKDAVRLQAHGTSNHAPIGSLGLVVFAYNRRDMPTLVGVEHTKHRPKDTPEGGQVIYDHKGNVTKHLGDGGIQTTAEKGGVSTKAKKGDVAQEAVEGHVTHKPGSGKRQYLGGDGVSGSYARVQTESGPSMNVYARIS